MNSVKDNFNLFVIIDYKFILIDYMLMRNEK